QEVTCDNVFVPTANRFPCRGRLSRAIEGEYCGIDQTGRHGLLGLRYDFHLDPLPGLVLGPRQSNLIVRDFLHWKCLLFTLGKWLVACAGRVPRSVRGVGSSARWFAFRFGVRTCYRGALP